MPSRGVAGDCASTETDLPPCAVTFRSDHDAARARADELEGELERERAMTAAAIGELDAERAERARWEAALPTRRWWRLWRRAWRDSDAVDRMQVALLWIVALALLFTIIWAPQVLVSGRW